MNMQICENRRKKSVRKRNMRNSTRTIVMVGMFAAVLSVLSILVIPMPSGVPLTLQTFAVALCGYVLGAKRGAATVFVYLFLGAVGMPVFSGMHGGLSWLLNYTGGFLWGFLMLVALCGLGIRKKSTGFCAVISGVGLVLCHIMGVFQFALVAEVSVRVAFVTVSAPYLLKDVFFLIVAYTVAKPMRRAVLQGGFAQ